MTYIKFLENIIRSCDYENPIYTSILAERTAEEFQLPLKEAAAAVAVAIKRLIDTKTIEDLRFFQKGIYYRAHMTPFGETGINKEILIEDKYIAGDNGYETGYMMLLRMGLTTQIPAKRVIATNKAASCIRTDKILNISICPPKTYINSKNKYYLQVLDAIDLIEKAPVEAKHPYRLIANHINNAGLDYGELLSLAGKYYNKNTIYTLAQIAGERS